MAPVTLPVLAVGLVTCLVLEATKAFSYGIPMPPKVLTVLENYDAEQTAKRTNVDRARLVVQAIAALLLILALAFHVAEIGLIGLSIIVLQTAFNGIVQEHRIGPAFEEALPFTALLCVFFGIVAVISDQHLFQPVIDYVLQLPESQQPGVFYIANGVLSMISDNVFVATVYIGQVEKAFDAAIISRQQFELLAVAINTGTTHPQRGDAEWPSRIPVPAYLIVGAPHPAFLRAHGADGSALHLYDGHNGLDLRHLAAVGSSSRRRATPQGAFRGGAIEAVQVGFVMDQLLGASA